MTTADEHPVAVRAGSNVELLPGISVAAGGRLRRIGIATVRDLLRHLPMRYERQHAETSIEQLVPETIGTARGTVAATRSVPGRGGRGLRGRGRFEATLEEEGGQRLLLTWFNAGYLQDRIHPGMQLRVHGKVGLYRGYRQIVNPQWEAFDDASSPALAEGRLRPIYPATEHLPSAKVEQFIRTALEIYGDHIIDPLSDDMLRAKCMPTLTAALHGVHAPKDEEEAGAARRRLAFNELLLLQLGIALKRHYNRTVLEAPSLSWNEAIDTHIRDRFPFQLTSAQNRAIKQIAADLQRSMPMNRMLQGDVGSGKTVVALYALLMAVADRRQAALMAPTELLAEQHHMGISRMLEGSNVRLALVTAGQAPSGSAQRKNLLQQIAQGGCDLVIGTQALLAEEMRFRDLAVVVTDEQHRFGVLQRARLRLQPSHGVDASSPRQATPHTLLMTATPIPRTLSLALFGDLDVSTIDQLPPGRTPVATRTVTSDRSHEVYQYIASERVGCGEQAYIVVPTIGESGSESAAQLKNVREHAKMVEQRYFKDRRVATIHGRLKRSTRQDIMERFRAGEIDVLVATTVIEVGVDVPNATIMVVEHAERFGLAQLHQLRGRVGRNAEGKQSLCVFVGDPTTAEASERLEALVATNDGFRIAEHDLRIRGMGEFFGTRQHGAAALRVARIPDDLPLLQMARRDAESIVGEDPRLEMEGHRRLRAVLQWTHGDTIGLIDVG